MASSPGAQRYPHHPVGALRILALSRGGLGANVRRQARALAGQPFRIPSVNDAVTSGGGWRSRDPAM